MLESTRIGVDWDVDGALHEGRDCCFDGVRSGRPGDLIEASRFFSFFSFTMNSITA